MGRIQVFLQIQKNILISEALVMQSITGRARSNSTSAIRPPFSTSSFNLPHARPLIRTEQPHSKSLPSLNWNEQNVRIVSHSATEHPHSSQSQRQEIDASSRLLNSTFSSKTRLAEMRELLQTLGIEDIESAASSIRSNPSYEKINLKELKISAVNLPDPLPPITLVSPREAYVQATLERPDNSLEKKIPDATHNYFTLLPYLRMTNN
ncbi:MAG: hypothetical protein C5B47_07220 [Verrucomicrobia bacterium]|nr:MAG: hypothetical protein C5B47_07220 [Verrucomicrobiota bacterium]